MTGRRGRRRGSGGTSPRNACGTVVAGMGVGGCHDMSSDDGGGDTTAIPADGSSDVSRSWRVGCSGSRSWAWVVALVAGLGAVILATPVLEMGHDSRRGSVPAEVAVDTDVCASPSRAGPDAAASVAAVLAAHVPWVEAL